MFKEKKQILFYQFILKNRTIFSMNSTVLMGSFLDLSGRGLAHCAFLTVFAQEHFVSWIMYT